MDEYELENLLKMREIIKSEPDAIRFLRRRKVLASEQLCPGKNGHSCGAVMKERERKKGRGNMWRCSQKLITLRTLSTHTRERIRKG